MKNTFDTSQDCGQMSTFYSGSGLVIVANGALSPGNKSDYVICLGAPSSPHHGTCLYCRIRIASFLGFWMATLDNKKSMISTHNYTSW